MNSIRTFGFNDPIGTWKNIIVEGHGRLIAAKRLGITEVPIIRLEHLTDEQRKAYALAHNKTAELSRWDFEMLDTELEDITNIDMSAFGFELKEELPEEGEEVIEDNPIEKLPPHSRILVCSVSLFGTESEKIYELEIPEEKAEDILRKIQEEGNKITSRIREVFDAI